MSRKPESVIAPFLTELQARVKKEGIRIGSCKISLTFSEADPFLYKGVHVSLIGHNVARVKELGQEVVKELDGQVVSEGQLGSEGAAKI
jgi:hypothetical protein